MFEADPPGTTGLYRYSSVFCSMYRPAMSTTFIFRYASLAWLLHFRSNEPCQAATASLAYVVSHSTIASWSGTSASGPVSVDARRRPVSYTHLRAHETGRNLVCRLLLEKKKKKIRYNVIEAETLQTKQVKVTTKDIAHDEV